MISARWQRSAALMLAVAAAGLLLMLLAAQRRRERCALGVTCLQTGVPVWAQRFDEASGGFAKAEDLGATPVELLLEPGLYWFTLPTSSGAFAEAIVSLSTPGELPTLELQLRAPEPPLEGMRLVAEGDYQLGPPESAGDGTEPRTRHLRAFWIDTREVSNAQYRAYVQATGVDDQPPGWSVPYDPAMDDLPVCGILRSQAERYAAWVGKRLPTADESVAAARLPSGAASASTGFRCARSAVAAVSGRN